MLLSKYRNMIRRAAWDAAKSWGLDFDDVESQGYLVFMEALELYEEGRASFSTHLFSRLRTLNDYCEREVRLKGKSLPMLDDFCDASTAVSVGRRVAKHIKGDSTGEVFEGGVGMPQNNRLFDTNFEKFVGSLDYLESLTHLSQDAIDVLKFILLGDWGKPGSDIKPSLHSVQKTYREKGWMPSRTACAWEELSTWWKSQAA
jgi:hypothetical protein